MSPIHELKKKPSHDSWGKKTARSNKGLMYMSSKERLREREAERKRASIGAVGGGRLSSDRASEPRPDPILAETPISEEPHSSEGSPSRRDRDRHPSVRGCAAQPAAHTHERTPASGRLGPTRRGPRAGRPSATANRTT